MTVWSLLGYPAAPTMPPGAMPPLTRLAVSRAEGLHAWESVWRMGIDAGRTEGALVVAAIVAAVVVLALVAGVGSRLTGALVGWAKR